MPSVVITFPRGLVDGCLQAVAYDEPRFISPSLRCQVTVLIAIMLPLQLAVGQVLALSAGRHRVLLLRTPSRRRPLRVIVSLMAFNDH